MVYSGIEAGSKLVVDLTVTKSGQSSGSDTDPGPDPTGALPLGDNGRCETATPGAAPTGADIVDVSKIKLS